MLPKCMPLEHSAFGTIHNKDRWCGQYKRKEPDDQCVVISKADSANTANAETKDRNATQMKPKLVPRRTLLDERPLLEPKQHFVGNTLSGLDEDDSIAVSESDEEE